MAKSISINLRSTSHNFVKCTQCLFTWILFLQTGTNVDLSCIPLLQVYSVYILWSSTYNSNPHINSLDNYWPWYITETWCLVFFTDAYLGTKTNRLWFMHIIIMSKWGPCWVTCGTSATFSCLHEMGSVETYVENVTLPPLNCQG